MVWEFRLNNLCTNFRFRRLVSHLISFTVNVWYFTFHSEKWIIFSARIWSLFASGIVSVESVRSNATEDFLSLSLFFSDEWHFKNTHSRQLFFSCRIFASQTATRKPILLVHAQAHCTREHFPHFDFYFDTPDECPGPRVSRQLALPFNFKFQVKEMRQQSVAQRKINQSAWCMRPFSIHTKCSGFFFENKSL